MAQLARQRARRAETVLGVLLHRPRDDLGQRRGHAGVELVGTRWLVVEHGAGDLGQRAAGEGLLVGQQLVEHHAEREHVGAPVHRLLAHLLGRHVVGRAGGDVAGAVVLVRDARDAEVEHARLRAPDHEDVGRLDVAVDHALAVRVGQRVGDAPHDGGGLRRRRPPAFLAQLAQVAALEQLHRDVGALVAHAGVEHRDDVRVREAASGARLVQEQRVEGLALFRRDLEVQGLDRDEARQQRVVRRVHRAQAARADLVLERIAADVPDGGHLVVGLGLRVGGEHRRRAGRRADVRVAPQRDVGRGGRQGGRHGIGRLAVRLVRPRNGARRGHFDSLDQPPGRQA